MQHKENSLKKQINYQQERSNEKEHYHPNTKVENEQFLFDTSPDNQEIKLRQFNILQLEESQQSTPPQKLYYQQNSQPQNQTIFIEKTQKQQQQNYEQQCNSDSYLCMSQNEDKQIHVDVLFQCQSDEQGDFICEKGEQAGETVEETKKQKTYDDNIKQQEIDIAQVLINSNKIKKIEEKENDQLQNLTQFPLVTEPPIILQEIQSFNKQKQILLPAQNKISTVNGTVQSNSHTINNQHINNSLPPTQDNQKMQNKYSKSQYINILLLIIVATFLMWIVIDQDENILDRIRNYFKCLMIVILGGILIALTIMEKTMKNMNTINKEQISQIKVEKVLKKIE